MYQKMDPVTLEQRRNFYSTIFTNLKSIGGKRQTLWPIGKYSIILNALEDAGCINPQIIITSWPGIMSLNANMIAKRFEKLKNLGFKDIETMILKQPSILAFSDFGISTKINALITLGFHNLEKDDPIRTITRFPAILTLNSDTIKNKIDFLKSLGFNKPTKLITSIPTILGLSTKNINIKLDLFKRITTKANFSAVELIEHSPILLTLSTERIFLAARYLYDKKIQVTIKNFGTCVGKTKQSITENDLMKYPKLRLRYLKYCNK